ncbi:MAG TPA: non-homologous end-joining DNA ligase [Prosthecobacter sp.]|nr:non-homologous end-joining DNA ligase [Prosthecobacter sp.]
MSLKEYIKKRDFKKTAEPAPSAKPRAGKTQAPRFVIQKHAASRLHYDFRLELGGTLKSWAVPKGIPFTKGEKRLAVHVEDHPVSYMDFEGTIPKGQYGGGTVMVWDIGTFEPLTDAPLKDLEKGKLHFTLSGKKLKGEWYLVQLRGSDQWLLIRGGDSVKPVSTKQDDTSAISGRSMDQIAGGGRVWQSKPASSNGKEAGAKKAAPKKAAAKRAKALPVPEYFEPMKARLVESAPADGDWIYEIKFDGFRALALKGADDTRLLSRTEKDLGGKFPEVLDAVRELAADDCVLDGEIVALDENGRSSFQMLQAYEMDQVRPPLCYYVFDLPRLDGKDLRALPLTERKEQLKKLLQKAPDTIRYSASLEGDIDSLLDKAQSLGLEGLIGKKKNSRYESGLRTGSWVKLKIVKEQEFVIGGYTAPSGSRSHFGSLVLGVYDNKKLQCVGKVGTGFNTKSLRSLHDQFQKLVQEECPFANLPAKKSGRWGGGITNAEMRKCTWLKPQIVCQIKFSEWTRDNRLRHPVFVGLREDKKARDVVRETAS